MAIEVKLGCVANLYGDTEPSHTHSFDHLTLLAAGSVKCVANGKETIFKAPHMIYINKDTMHEFTALENNTVAYCIHAMRIGEKIEDIVDPTMIPDGAMVPFSLSYWWSPKENYNGENKDVVNFPSTKETGVIEVTKC
jgi:hypothetical protein